MEAGLELFGTLGYARTSVRAVSAAASLNSRYFYESYRSREDLLYAVYQRIVTDLFTRAVEATTRETSLEEQARAGVRAAWTAVTEDRRKARIVAIEAVGVSERLERLRQETRQALAQLTADNAMSLAGQGIKLRLGAHRALPDGRRRGGPARMDQRRPGRLRRRGGRALHRAVHRGGTRHGGGRAARPRPAPGQRPVTARPDRATAHGRAGRPALPQDKVIALALL
jgi:AcrR family transcriptional regulator